MTDSSQQLERAQFKRDAVIFHEGEPGSFAYLIERGKVEISAVNHGQKIVINTLSAGDMFGEMALIDNLARSATATALEDTDVIPFDRKQFESKLDGADPVLHMLLRVIIKRFRWALHKALEKERMLITGDLTGSGQTQIFDLARDEAIQQIRLEHDLKDALTNKEFTLRYQPVVEADSHRIAGFEALIRWNHPEKGCVLPGNFISAAEDSDLIVPIGHWVLEQAAHDLKKLQSARALSVDRNRPLFMTVNVSSRQIQHLAKTDVLSRTIEEAGIEARNLKLEFTESILIRSPEIAAKALFDIRDLGVSLAIDDFGTGYSSLSYLHRFPLDVLKIDRSFVNMMTKDHGSLQIVRAIMGLSKGLGLQTVAEGIEDRESLQLLVGLGCDFIQGYLASRPVPLETAIEYVSDGVDLLTPQGGHSLRAGSA